MALSQIDITVLESSHHEISTFKLIENPWWKVWYHYGNTEFTSTLLCHGRIHKKLWHSSTGCELWTVPHSSPDGRCYTYSGWHGKAICDQESWHKLKLHSPDCCALCAKWIEVTIHAEIMCFHMFSRLHCRWSMMIFTPCEASELEWMQPCHIKPKLIGYCNDKNSAFALFRKEAKWVASLDPKATPDEKDAIKKAIW